MIEALEVSDDVLPRPVTGEGDLVSTSILVVSVVCHHSVSSSGNGCIATRRAGISLLRKRGILAVMTTEFLHELMHGLKERRKAGRTIKLTAVPLTEVIFQEVLKPSRRDFSGFTDVLVGVNVSIRLR